MQRVFLIILLVTASAYTVSAKEWRGLMPLRSTREDVEKLLGQPPPLPKNGSRYYTLNKGRSIYFLDEGEVYIVFAEKEFSGPRDCLMTVPVGTVLMIQITPKTKLAIADFIADGKKFRKFDPSDPPGLGYEAYLNEEEGFIVRAFKGVVDQLIYVASALDKPQCPIYYENLEGFVRIMVCGLSVKFDEYGDISFSDEKARLDNFAIQLQNQADARGYLIVYAGQKALVAEAQTRANRAKEYLLNIRGLKGDKIIALDGGHRDSFAVELYIVAQDAAAPIPTPTIEASQVEVIYEKKRRSRKKPH